MKKIILSLFIVLFSSFNFLADAENGVGPATSSDALPLILKKGRGRRSGGSIQGKHIITAGVVFNGLAPFVGVNYPASKFWKDSLPFHGSGMSVSQVAQSPLINLMMDFGLADKISMGFAFSYQTMSVIWGGTWVPYQDVYTRIGAALRFDYHFVAEDNVAFYAGIRAGYNYYTMTSTYQQNRSYTNYQKTFDGGPSVIAAQAHLGFSYFFAGLVGLNLEAGYSYGETYTAGAGLTFKF